METNKTDQPDIFKDPLYAHVRGKISFYALNLYRLRLALLVKPCTHLFTAIYHIICPCEQKKLKKNKGVSARGTLPLEKENFDQVYELTSAEDMNPRDVNPYAVLSASAVTPRSPFDAVLSLLARLAASLHVVRVPHKHVSIEAPKEKVRTKGSTTRTGRRKGGEKCILGEESSDNDSAHYEDGDEDEEGDEKSTLLLDRTAHVSGKEKRKRENQDDKKEGKKEEDKGNFKDGSGWKRRK